MTDDIKVCEYHLIKFACLLGPAQGEDWRKKEIYWQWIESENDCVFCQYFKEGDHASKEKA